MQERKGHSITVCKAVYRKSVDYAHPRTFDSLKKLATYLGKSSAVISSHVRYERYYVKSANGMGYLITQIDGIDTNADIKQAGKRTRTKSEVKKNSKRRFRIRYLLSCLSRNYKDFTEIPENDPDLVEVRCLLREEGDY